MTKVIQHLWFEKDMEAAIRLYTSIVPGSTLGRSERLAADTPSGPAGSVKMAEFMLGGQRYRAIEAGPLDPFNRSFSIMVECDDQAEIDRLWTVLTDGGLAGRCGWLKDRWGLSWQITARRLANLIGDPVTTKRAMEALLTMTKVDLAALDAAVA